MTHKSFKMSQTLTRRGVKKRTMNPNAWLMCLAEACNSDIIFSTRGRSGDGSYMARCVWYQSRTNQSTDLIMAILLQPQTTKKRNRPSTQESSSSRQVMSSKKTADDEYEHAVAFLRDFHSRRVATYAWPFDPSPSSSSSSVSAMSDCATLCCNDKLAPIKEEELRSSTNSNGSTISSAKATSAVSLDDMLSADFALALTVDNNNNRRRGDITPSSTVSSFYSSSSTSSSPRMKKAKTTKCLLDLGRGSTICVEQQQHQQHLQQEESNSAFSSSSSSDEGVRNANSSCSSEEDMESVTSSSDDVSSCNSSSSRRSSYESSSSIILDDYFIRDLPSPPPRPSTNTSITTKKSCNDNAIFLVHQ